MPACTSWHFLFMIIKHEKGLYFGEIKTFSFLTNTTHNNSFAIITTQYK